MALTSSKSTDRRRIVNFSRRVDCAPFQEWFLRRLDEGVAHGINPFTKQPYEVGLTASDVKLLVFWTKAPARIVDMVNAVVGHGIATAVFTTINDYDKWLEPWVPPLTENLAGLRAINSLIGPQSVWWRFDPVVPTNTQDLAWFKKHVTRLCRQMRGFTTRCITSVVNTAGAPKYRNCAININKAAMAVGQQLRQLTRREKLCWVGELSSAVQQEIGLPLEVCCHPFLDNNDISADQRKTKSQFLLSAEEVAMVRKYPHLRVAHCIDGVALDRLGVVGDRRDGSHSLGSKRKGDIRYDLGMCRCRQSTDIGGDVACPHGCVYCQWPHATDQGQVTIQVAPSSLALTAMTD